MSHQFSQKRLSELQLYDEISIFIKNFKTALQLMESASICHFRGNEFQPAIVKIKELLLYFQNFFEKYQSLSENIPIEKITFRRFLGRLVESITIYKIKYQIFTQSNSFQWMIQTLKEIQNCFNHAQDQKNNISKVAIIVLRYIENFCMKFEGNIKSIQNNAITVKKINFSDSKKPLISSIKLLSQQCFFKKMSHQTEIEDLEEQQNKKKQAIKQTTYEKISQNTFSNLQKNFETYSCMGLDYASFRSNNFEARQSADTASKKYIEKNTFSSKIIKNYYQDYQNFLRKKKLKILKINKRKLKSQYGIDDQPPQKNYRTLNQKIQEEESKKFILQNNLTIHQSRQKNTKSQSRLKFDIFETREKEKNKARGTAVQNRLFEKFKNDSLKKDHSLNFSQKSKKHPETLPTEIGSRTPIPSIQTIIQTSNNKAQRVRTFENQDNKSVMEKKRQKYHQLQNIFIKKKGKNVVSNCIKDKLLNANNKVVFDGRRFDKIPIKSNLKFYSKVQVPLQVNNY